MNFPPLVRPVDKILLLLFRFEEEVKFAFN